MKTLALLTLFFALDGQSASAGNPVSRYFQRVPIERAHLSWGGASGLELPGKKLSVLVWNVKKGVREVFPAEFKKYGENKDILLIQEAYTADFFTNALASFRNYQWELGISFEYRMYGNDGTGNMIGSHATPRWVKVEHTLDLEPVTATPKTTAYARYAVEGKTEELLVISMHGINFANLGAFTRHLDQLKGHIADHSGPVILAGDFNTRTKERYRQVQTLAKGLGLSEVELTNGNLRMTSVGTSNFLDHAFVRGFTVRHAEVFDSKGSDHKPMTIDLEFTEEPSLSGTDLL